MNSTSKPSQKKYQYLKWIGRKSKHFKIWYRIELLKMPQIDKIKNKHVCILIYRKQNRYKTQLEREEKS